MTSVKGRSATRTDYFNHVCTTSDNIRDIILQIQFLEWFSLTHCKWLWIKHSNESYIMYLIYPCIFEFVAFVFLSNHRSHFSWGPKSLRKLHHREHSLIVVIAKTDIRTKQWEIYLVYTHSTSRRRFQQFLFFDCANVHYDIIVSW